MNIQVKPERPVSLLDLTCSASHVSRETVVDCLDVRSEFINTLRGPERAIEHHVCGTCGIKRLNNIRLRLTIPC